SGKEYNNGDCSKNNINARQSYFSVCTREDLIHLLSPHFCSIDLCHLIMDFARESFYLIRETVYMPAYDCKEKTPIYDLETISPSNFPELERRAMSGEIRIKASYLIGIIQQRKIFTVPTL